MIEHGESAFFVQMSISRQKEYSSKECEHLKEYLIFLAVNTYDFHPEWNNYQDCTNICLKEALNPLNFY